MLDQIPPDLFGAPAAVLTTIAFVPQVIKSIRTRSTADVSLGMFAILTTGVALWLVYGIMLGSLPIIFANAVTLALTATMVVLKMTGDRRRP